MDVLFLFGGCGREIDEGGRPREGPRLTGERVAVDAEVK